MTTPVPSRSPTRSRSQASRRQRASVHSDCPPEVDAESPIGNASPGLEKRSVSLVSLQTIYALDLRQMFNILNYKKCLLKILN